MAKKKEKKTAKKIEEKKPIEKKPAEKKTTEKTVPKSVAPYIEGIGRRKTASARVRLTPAKTQVVMVNDKSLSEYFHSQALEHAILSVFAVNEAIGNYAVSAHVAGGGIRGHADAIRLGIARALVKEDPNRRIPLKRAGLLMRDPRSKERRKFGLKKARKAPQWSTR